MQYPQSEKMAKCKGDMDAIRAFLTFAKSKGVMLAHYPGESDHLHQYRNEEELLYELYGIDKSAYEQELEALVQNAGE